MRGTTARGNRVRVADVVVADMVCGRYGTDPGEMRSDSEIRSQPIVSPLQPVGTRLIHDVLLPSGPVPVGQNNKRSK